MCPPSLYSKITLIQHLVIWKSQYPIINHKRKVVPKLEVLHFYKKKSSMKQAHLRNMFKKAYKSVCTSAAVVFPDTPPVSYSISFYTDEDSIGPDGLFILQRTGSHSAGIHVPFTNCFVCRWFCVVHDPKPPLHSHN